MDKIMLDFLKIKGSNKNYPIFLPNFVFTNNSNRLYHNVLTKQKHPMKLFRIYTLIAGAIIFFSCSQKQQVDLIIHNAVIYTVDEGFSIQESAAIKDGLFVAVGSNDYILENYRANNVSDLEGRFVYPGLIDPHCHFFGYGRNLEHADLVGSRSFEAIIGILKEHQDNYPSEWLLGRGWDQNLWPVQEFPHRRQLDAVFPDTPVLLTRIDGHAAIANTEALRRAGITAQTRVDGGDILLQNGEPTGILIDQAIYLVRSQIPAPSRQDEITALINAQQRTFAVGLTSVGDAGLDKETIRLIDSLQQSGDLKMRVYAMLSPSEENFEAFMYQGPYKTDHLHVRSVKLFADGALGSRGAKLLEPYSDEPGNRGLLVETPEFMREISQKAFEHNYQVNVHCIGDSAVRLVLDIFGEVLGGPNDRRWRIEHAQIVHPDDMDRFGAYDIVPSIQTTHATSDMIWAAHRLGPERIKTAYAYQELLQQNGWLPNGSDFPVEHINPLYGFYAAIARKNLDGYPQGGWQMENALTREQAMRGMTIWAAKSQFEEDEKGSIEPGKFADFIVMDHDLMNIGQDEIPGLPIRKTFVGGKKVFEN
jgi:predicted amidohydrolase YtcJ